MIVVDASVAALWYLPQPLSGRAAALLARGEELAAPPLLRLEVASAIAKAVRRREVSAGEARHALEALLPASVRFVPGVEESPEPWRIVEAFGGSVYDAVYIALARRLAAPLSTDDRELAETARRAGVAASLLREA